jgi:hypothetical protein
MWRAVERGVNFNGIKFRRVIRQVVGGLHACRIERLLPAGRGEGSSSDAKLRHGGNGRYITSSGNAPRTTGFFLDHATHRFTALHTCAESGAARECHGVNPTFERYIGIDHSDAETPSLSLKPLRSYAADRLTVPSRRPTSSWLLLPTETSFLCIALKMKDAPRTFRRVFDNIAAPEASAVWDLLAYCGRRSQVAVLERLCRREKI